MRSSTGDGSEVPGGWPDAPIGAIAGPQRTLITHAQLASLGVSDSAISRSVARGRMHRVYRGVYSLVPPEARPPLAGELAAVLLHGAAAILSHETAARLHGLPIAGPTNTVHVTLVGKARRGCPGAILIHRVTAIHPQEHHRLRGLPVTSLARTVIDLSPGLAPRARERLVDEAIKRTSETKLREALARHPGRPGTPAIRALLGGDRPSTLTWSVAEERLLTLIRTAGLPTPEVNIPLEHGYVPDLLWRAERVIVEFDSYTHHSGPAAFRDDRTRHNALTALGYQLLHVTWDQLTRYPERVLVWIARALAAG